MRFNTMIKWIVNDPKIILRAILEPKFIVRAIFSILPNTKFSTKLVWDAMLRPNYGYCIYQAALQAKALNIDKISVIEFGVATGDGLMHMELISEEISKELDLEIEIYGFDTGEGMPPTNDNRDLPYIWQPGFFKMNFDKVNNSLKKASLILGNVSKTVPKFIKENKPAPIGFISIDLDYYTSTIDALKILEQPSKYYLPRVFCYFDDIVGGDLELHSEFAGELLAIKEFNEKSKDKKIAKIYGLPHKRQIKAQWTDQMFVYHDFGHPLYSKHVYPDKRWGMDP